jgi:hypothetical protein
MSQAATTRFAVYPNPNLAEQVILVGGRPEYQAGTEVDLHHFETGDHLSHTYIRAVEYDRVGNLTRYRFAAPE